MRTSHRLSALLAVAGLLSGFAFTSANAAPACRSAVSGSAASLGILGIGSATARATARANWEANAYSAYGSRYSSFYKARGVRWNCKPGFIMPATCVVVARPCRY